MAVKGISFRDRFARLYREGYTVSAIAKLHSVTRETVEWLLRGAGFAQVHERDPNFSPPPPKPPASPRPGRPATTSLVVSQPQEPPQTRTWCSQCERQVYTNEASACQSRWCKAKEAA